LAENFLIACFRRFNFHNPVERTVISPSSGYAIAAGVFMLLSVIALKDFLFGNSFYIYRDVVWPAMNVDLLLSNLYSLDLESVRRIIFLGPFFLMTQILGASSLVAEKTLFLLIKFLIGFFAYVGVYNFLSSKIKNGNKNIIFIVSMFAGYYYAYNPAATSMVSATFFFAFSYSLIPLVFYFFDKALNEKGFYNVFMASTLITLCIAGVTQLLVILPVFLLIPWFIVVCVKRGRLMVSNTIKKFSYILIISFLMSFYYIIVALSIYAEGVTLQPSYVITYDFLHIISLKTNLLDVIRLMGDWWPRIELVPIIDYNLWLALSFVIPITAGLFILFSRNTEFKFYVLCLSIIALLVIFVHKGTSPPFSEFYLLLYDLPIVGWMFRIPSKFAMILAFFVMMILSLGFYNLLVSSKNPMRRYFKYFLFAGFIISLSVISWPMFTGNLGGIYKEGQYPENDSTKSDDDNNVMNIPKENIAILGGLDKLTSLNMLESFNKSGSSLTLIDQSLGTKLKNMTAIDKIVLDDRNNLAMHLLSANAIIIEPFDATKRQNPKNVWSVAGTNDPIQGPFHAYLDRFSVKNYDIDYGKGLVFTWANDKLEVPINVAKSGSYTLYVRYMENKQGGSMNIYFDNNLISGINSLDEKNKFVWKDIGELDITRGRHTVSLENIHGLNAVNIFALVPSQEIHTITSQVHDLAQKPRNIHILEAESNFNAPGKYNGDDSVFSPSNGTFNKTFLNVLKIPQNSDKASLQFWTKQNPTSASSYKIKSFEITPMSNTKNIYTSDFEDISEELNYYSSYGNNSISVESKSPISGTNSLRIDVKGDPNSNSWNVVSTDLTLINNTGKIRYQLSVSAIDVNSLHSKVIYYDSNGNEINTNYIFFGSGDRFNNTYAKSAEIPQGTKYISLQFWAKANSKGAGSYLVDEVKIVGIYPDKSFKNNFEIFGNSYADERQNVTIDGRSLTVNLKKGNTADWIVVQSKPIKISDDLLYKYSMDVEATNTDSLQSKLLYLTDTTEHSSKYGVQDGILVMGAGSEILSTIDLLKASEYTIATKVKTCQQCSSLIVRIGDAYKELSLKNDKDELKWLYFTVKLPAGNTGLNIHSNGETELDKVVIYSESFENETLDKLFTQKETYYSKLDYNKINPTQYQVQVNTTKPFLLEFAEPYHPLWRTFLNGKEYEPIQLYSESAKKLQGNVATNYPAINGFIIDQTGRLDLTIKYKPLNWFWLGATVSILIFAISLAYLAWERREKIIYLFKPLKTKIYSMTKQDLKNRKH
jgi:archaellin